MSQQPNQLKPLKNRLTDEQLRARAAKTAVRAQLSREHAITRGIAVSCYSVLTRGLVGRLKWLLRGK